MKLGAREIQTEFIVKSQPWENIYVFPAQLFVDKLTVEYKRLIKGLYCRGD